MTVIVAFTGIATFVAGWLPTRIAELLASLWNFNTELKGPPDYVRVCKGGYGYRVIRVRSDGRKVKMPLAPWSFLLALFVVRTIVLHWKTWGTAFAVAFVVLTILVVVCPIGKWLREFVEDCADWAIAKHEEKLQARKEQRSAKEKVARLEYERRYAEWMRMTLLTEMAPSKVNLHNLPVAFEKGTARRFWVSFWALKARVCKPYAR